MDKFNFDQLMNIEVPQSCIEKALKIPAETKKAASPVRFYRFAAGIAACVVIAAAVIFPLSSTDATPVSELVKNIFEL